MGGFPEDNSFLIYVSIRKGFSVGKAASRVAAIIHDATGNVLGNPVLLKDDGQCKNIKICLTIAFEEFKTKTKTIQDSGIKFLKNDSRVNKEFQSCLKESLEIGISLFSLVRLMKQFVLKQIPTA